MLRERPIRRWFRELLSQKVKHTYLSKPSYATHSTTHPGFLWIMESRSLDMMLTGRPLSLSLDGVFHEINRPTVYATFLFDLEEIKTRLAPVLYLLISGVRPEKRDGYYLQNWKYFCEAEVLYEGSIPLNLVKCVLSDDYEALKIAEKSGFKTCWELPQSRFREELVETFWSATEALAVLPKARRPEEYRPPEWLADFLHTYNRLVSEMFNLNYLSILEDVRKYPPHIYMPF